MYDRIKRAAQAHGLEIYGALHPDETEVKMISGGTLILLGTGTGFWPLFKASSEALDHAPDPIDRWSTRILGDLAHMFKGDPYFPFGGPPYTPFINWALASGRCFPSPAGPMVHDRMGMLISFRGALHLPFKFDIPAPLLPVSPCDSCVDKPCTTTCPVGAMNLSGTYGLQDCYDFLETPAGSECMEIGCIARRACPLSQNAGRNPEQTSHHMRYFKAP
ncbi:MAG: ferredoxin [Rhodobacteraceae bacterium]|nr:ferredoxin [Paracoccaceae bacterium]